MPLDEESIPKDSQVTAIIYTTIYKNKGDASDTATSAQRNRVTLIDKQII